MSAACRTHAQISAACGGAVLLPSVGLGFAAEAPGKVSVLSWVGLKHDLSASQEQVLDLLFICPYSPV